MWKVLHSRWTVVLCVECSVLQWTVCGRYCTAGGQWYYGLNELCYSELYLEGTAQQVDCGIVCWMECVTVNCMWKVLHSRWTVVLWVEWIVLQWTLFGRYCTASGHWYCGLNGMCDSEHYVVVTAQQVGSVIAGWMECVNVKIIWKVLHSRWRLLEDSGIGASMECVTVTFICVILHNKLTVLWNHEISAFYWT